MSDTPDAPTTDDVARTAPSAEIDGAELDGAETASVASTAVETALDLDLIERDLADVELALARLDAGTYWTDEVTGGVIPDERLAEHPTARRLADR